MSWNPQQQAMLSAMGYTLYRQAAPGAPEAQPRLDDVRPAASPARPAAADASVRAPQPRGYASPAPGADTDRLLKALVRAAGGAEASTLPLPPLDELRASAAAKRALWPRLRALRRHR